MLEFTGERVIPGQVDPDLFNEHLARYLFAARQAAGKRCLDAGCGVGYGADCLAEAALSVVAIDLDPQAVAEARSAYPRRNLHFATGDACALPMRSGCFEIAVSFEVLEHLEAWREYLRELRRVTAPDGLVIISTPNRTYYNQSRGDAGPNPFHFHEFTHDEFLQALESEFAHVKILTQNHTPAITISGELGEGDVSASPGSARTDVADAQFFVAVCSQQPIPEIPAFTHIPDSANVLAERERHIALLKDELQLKATWLETAQQDLQNLAAAHQKLDEEHAERSKWAIETIRGLEKDNQRLASELQETVENLKKSVESLHETEQLVEERTQWARKLDTEIHELYAQRSSLLARVDELTKQLEQRSAQLMDTESRLHALEHKRLLELRRVGDDLGVGGAHQIVDADRLVEDVMRAAEDVKRLFALLESLRASRWLKLGKAIGVGPNLEGSKTRP